MVLANELKMGGAVNMIYLHPYARNSAIIVASRFKFRITNLNESGYTCCKRCAVKIKKLVLQTADSDKSIINRIRESLDRLFVV